MTIADLLSLAGYLVLPAAFAGVLAGLLGVGGGIVLVPAFLFTFGALGYDNAALMQICLATSLATIIVTSLRSLGKHRAKGAVDVDTLKTWAPGIMVGAGLGVLVANGLSSDALKVVFGALTTLIGIWLALGRTDLRLGDAMPGGALRAGLSSVTGFLSTLLGIGGGSIGVPLMTLFGHPIHRAVGTASGFGLLIAVPSVLGFLLSPVPEAGRPPLTIGAVNVPTFVIVVILTWLTAPLGVALAHRMNAERLRRVFGVFLFLVGARMVWSIL